MSTHVIEHGTHEVDCLLGGRNERLLRGLDLEPGLLLPLPLLRGVGCLERLVLCACGVEAEARGLDVRARFGRRGNLRVERRVPGFIEVVRDGAVLRQTRFPDLVLRDGVRLQGFPEPDVALRERGVRDVRGGVASSQVEGACGEFGTRRCIMVSGCCTMYVL